MGNDIPEAMGRVNENENRSKISISAESKEEADKLFNGLYSIKFDPYIGKDAFPVIIPLLHGQAADSSRLAFHSAALYTELGILK